MLLALDIMLVDAGELLKRQRPAGNLRKICVGRSATPPEEVNMTAV